MTIRPILWFVVLTTAAFAHTSANAHDLRDFDRRMEVAEAQALPEIWTNLAKRTEQASDAANPDIKALKTRCDAEKKAAMQKKKAVNPTVKSGG
ncbi:MAG: hypothetical protein ACR2J7_10440 [Luteimonas sp.]